MMPRLEELVVEYRKAIIEIQWDAYSNMPVAKSAIRKLIMLSTC
jgi:hypothetical protein